MLSNDTPALLQTIENTREKDETVVSLDDAEVEADEAQDEFAGTKPFCLVKCMTYSASDAGPLLWARHVCFVGVAASYSKA